MAWKDRLQDASFRGVPFKFEGEGAAVGRRVETHEYPNRDKPYTEDPVRSPSGQISPMSSATIVSNNETD